MITWVCAIPLAVLAICVASCATRPEKIVAKEADPAIYADWSCEQLEDEQTRLGEALTLASDEQRNARQNDTLGWILVGLPMGGGHKEVLAELKGKLGAVQKAMIQNECSGGMLKIEELMEKKKDRKLESKS